MTSLLSQVTSKHYCVCRITFSHLRYDLWCPDYHSTDCNQSINVYKENSMWILIQQKKVTKIAKQNAEHKLNWSAINFLNQNDNVVLSLFLPSGLRDLIFFVLSTLKVLTYKKFTILLFTRLATVSYLLWWKASKLLKKIFSWHISKIMRANLIVVVFKWKFFRPKKILNNVVKYLLWFVYL